MSNLALAQSQLNKWSLAIDNINASLELLRQDSELNDRDRVRALAQVLNNQGILQHNRGQNEEAIAAWDRAKSYYQQLEDDLGVIRASINQASAFKQLGLYRRALKTLSEVESSLEQQPNSELKVAGLRSYGDILRLVGQIKKSREVLQSSLAIASELESAQSSIEIRLMLGNTYKAHRQKKALALYEQAFDTCRQDSNCLQTDLPVQIYLAQLNTQLNTPQWHLSKSLIKPIEQEFVRLPVNRTNIDRRINFAHSLVELSHRANHRDSKAIRPTDSRKIEEFLDTTIV